MIVPFSGRDLLGVRSPRNECRRSAHNLLLLGPPGAGKSMLARRLTTILPAMTLAEAIETTRIHRVGGLTGARTAWVTTRRFRAPHHTISDVGLIGGGTCRCRATCPWPTMACASWMHGPSSAATSWRSCGNRSRTASSIYNLASVLDVAGLALLVDHVHGGTG
jgi:hypothetical protein